MLNAAGLTVRTTRPHHHVDPPTGRTATDGAPGLLLPDGDDRGGVLGGRRELLLGAAGTSCTCACGAALTHSHSHAAPAPPADRWTDAAFASAMDHGMRDYERRVQGVKRSLFARAGLAGAEVLEVGVGTGPSMGLLAEAGVRRVHGIEPNLAMHGSARRHAEEAGLEVRLEPGRAEALPVADSSVVRVHDVAGVDVHPHAGPLVRHGVPLTELVQDVVLATMLLCSVGDGRAALREVLRVLKPGGRLVFVEHGEWRRRGPATRAPAG